MLVPSGASGEQASEPTSPAAGELDVGANFSCAIVAAGQVRCWGYGGEGELGYPGVTTVGATDTPAAEGPVDIGAGYTATAISSGDYHTCAIRKGGTVVCWGFGGNGRLGYGDTNNVGDTETPGSAGAVSLGIGRTALAITAGGDHTCAILDNHQVACWGFGTNGQLGYGSTANVGDSPSDTPDIAGTVNLGTGRTATAISAGGSHTCAILDHGQVECWGYGGNGRLGYGSTSNVGDTSSDTPAIVGPVNLGTGHTAVAISAGGSHTCVILNDGTVRCWGFGFDGQLGYGTQNNAGDTTTPIPDTPDTLPAVDLGIGRKAVAITTGSAHTCAILDNGSVECWGYGADGQLGYGNTNNVGDTPTDTPGVIGPVSLGAGRTAIAISAGGMDTCARLDDGSLKCWGYDTNGQLGYCTEANVGDTPTSTPDMFGPVNLIPGDGGQPCASPAPAPLPAASAPPTAVTKSALVSDPDAARRRAFLSCLAKITARAKRLTALAHHGSQGQRAGARRRLARALASGRRQCIARYGHTPGRVTILKAFRRGQTAVELDFVVVGTDGNSPPAAQTYLIKQSLHPIRTERDFEQAQALCRGTCHFDVQAAGGGVHIGGGGEGNPTGLCAAGSPAFRAAARSFATGSGQLQIGMCASLTITSLNRHTIYYYAIAARDNVTARPGPRSPTVHENTA